MDLILLDLIMPNKDGISVLEQMMEKNITKKVIVLTSYNTQEMIRKVSELGVTYFILKPFELSDLEKRIKEASNGIIIEGKTMKEVALFVANRLAPMDCVVSTGTHFVLKKSALIRYLFSLILADISASVLNLNQ